MSQDRLRLKLRPPSVGVPQGFADLYFDADAILTQEMSGGEKQVVGGGSASISNAEYSSDWNGYTDVAPSKNAVYDKLVTMDAGIAAATASGTGYVKVASGVMQTPSAIVPATEITGTKAQFQAAMTDDDFVTLAGTSLISGNKVFADLVISGTDSMLSVGSFGGLDGTVRFYTGSTLEILDGTDITIEPDAQVIFRDALAMGSGSEIATLLGVPTYANLTAANTALAISSIFYNTALAKLDITTA